MSAVGISNVAKYYGKVAALDDVSMTVQDGEFFGLLGPSGGGKTTLLRAIAGFVEPDRGEITIAGKAVSNIPINKRDIGMMFQNYALFPHLTVAENIGFGLSVRHRPKAEIAERVRQLLELVRLSGFEGRKPKQMSGGQQQRIALARALSTNPKVLLLDEPLGALDKKLREEMQFELKQIQRDVGITTVFVTHDQEEALTLSDRIAIMNGGRVEQIGAPRDIYERPRTAFAASFLGTANFFEGVVSGRGDGVTRIELPDGQAIFTTDEAPAGARVTAAVRPEKLLAGPVGAQGQEGRTNTIQGRVMAEVFAGNSVTYKVDAGNKPVTVFVQNRTDERFGPDQTIALTWAPYHTILVAA
ncbi:ABC transporter ATP-binding protein [Kumtagia ephedrae]|jgi:spermidine/putrescine ABC transporter ATP-binding subunit|uniref:Spermidine/putrescine import ATP-binding protein PotA n=1 Tax=Kumtagia ephedrae TaxID=2116701 RepID=A0A2P7SM30_9HYPH|nr:ABC transporter ATP-binding protein [Mesorhizobium ephedrae]PSJ63445.1 spermidine/putrescine ABC transporter ATP-binding protein [Mesorhizobium ephedrae]